MEWSDLKVFLAAVRAGSYTAAGRRLGVNRTTVGRRIDALEDALGVALFEETPLGPSPTSAGERLLAAAQVIENEVDCLLNALGAEARQVDPVRIASSAGIATEFLPELIAFRRANPAIGIELLGELDPVDAVTHRRADLAIALVRVPPLRLAGVQVATLSQAIYAHRELVGTAAPLGWGHEVGAALPGGQWTAANPAGDTAELARLATFNSWPQLKQAVLAGMGSAALWCFAADAEPSLERLAGPDPRHDSPLWLLYRAKSPPGSSLARLVAFLETALASRLGR